MKKVKRGESIARHFTADAYNAFVDAANVTQRFRTLGIPRLGNHRGGELPGQILVRNKSGSAVARRNVLGIDVSTFGNSLQFQQRPIIDGVTPTSSHVNAFVVADEPIPNNAVGSATIDGVVPVKVDISDSAHTAAVAKASTKANLESKAEGGARILWRQASTGNVWCLVRLADTLPPAATPYTHTYGQLSGPTDTYNLLTEERIDFTAGISGGITADTTNDDLEIPASDDYLIGFTFNFSIDSAGQHSVRVKNGASIVASLTEDYPTADAIHTISATFISARATSDQLSFHWIQPSIGGTGTPYFATLWAMRLD